MCRGQSVMYNCVWLWSYSAAFPVLPEPLPPSLLLSFPYNLYNTASHPKNTTYGHGYSFSLGVSILKTHLKNIKVPVWYEGETSLNSTTRCLIWEAKCHASVAGQIYTKEAKKKKQRCVNTNVNIYFLQKKHLVLFMVSAGFMQMFYVNVLKM